MGDSIGNDAAAEGSSCPLGLSLPVTRQSGPPLALKISVYSARFFLHRIFVFVFLPAIRPATPSRKDLED